MPRTTVGVGYGSLAKKRTRSIERQEQGHEEVIIGGDVWWGAFSPMQTGDREIGHVSALVKVQPG